VSDTPSEGDPGVPRGRGSPNARPPEPYKRCKLGPAPRRNRWWRRNALIAVNEAVKRADLSPQARAAFFRVLEFSNDHGKDCWPMIRTIAEAEHRAGRTMWGWLDELTKGGWLDKQHRAWREKNGTFRGQSNIWRPMVPGAYEQWLRDTGHLGGKGRATPRAPQNAPQGPPAPAPPAVQPSAPAAPGGPLVAMPGELRQLARTLPRGTAPPGRSPPARPGAEA